VVGNSQFITVEQASSLIEQLEKGVFKEKVEAMRRVFREKEEAGRGVQVVESLLSQTSVN